MKKKISSAVLIAAILVGAFLYAHVDKNIYLYDRSLESEDFINTGILEAGETLEPVSYTHLTLPTNSRV